MIDNKYPVDETAPGFVTLPKQQTDITDIVAIDCEMVSLSSIQTVDSFITPLQCTTINGLELTRVSIVDSKLNVLYDKLAKPTNPIINYNTK